MDLCSCLSFLSRSEALSQKFAVLCSEFLKIIIVAGESNEESTVNVTSKILAEKIVCAINKQNSIGTLCKTQPLFSKKNFSRQSNNKFRDRSHMIQARFYKWYRR